jgi:protein-disulfide isomerase
MKSTLARSVCLGWLAVAGACGEAGPREGTAESSAREAVASASERAETTETVAQATPAPQREKIDIAVLGFDRGAPDAPVRVIEMSDYGCGYCRKFHEETWPVLREEFVDAGKIEWKFLPFVSGMFKNSTAATRAAECVLEQGGERFEAMNHRIWSDQREWKGSAEPESVLRGLAGAVGADLGRYDSCLSENRREARVKQATALARQVGVRGTPTFFVLGYSPLQGALPTDAFRQVLGAVVADATATRDGGGR